MRCEVARESLSARMDGERESVPTARVDEHLRQCPGCAGWYRSVQGLSFGAADLAPDLSTAIIEASRTSPAPRSEADTKTSGASTAMAAAAVAFGVAAVVMCAGYFTGSPPAWYPVAHGVVGLGAIVLLVIALVGGWRSRHNAMADDGADVGVAVADPAQGVARIDDAEPVPVTYLIAPSGAEEAELSQMILGVTGLHCGGCVQTITTAVSGLDGVDSVRVDLDTHGVSKVTVESDISLGRDTVAAAITASGNFVVAGEV